MKRINSKNQYITVLIILLIFLVGCAEIEPVKTGILDSKEQSIINGVNFNANGSGYVMIRAGGTCSGTLIRNSWVLSAHHCFDAGDVANPQTVRITMGVQNARAAEVIMHPNLDAAIIHLDAPFTMDGSATGYVRELYAGDPAELNGQNINCFGYGRNTSAGGTGTLRTAQLSIASVLAHEYTIVPNAANQITWNGDSGGSCIYTDDDGNDVIATVVSWYENFRYNDNDGDGNYNPPPDTVQWNTVTLHHMQASALRPWVNEIVTAGEFGKVMASGDFNNDGFTDLAVSASTDGADNAGRVYIFTGMRNEMRLWQEISENLAVGVDGIPAAEAWDRFGYALAVGDFNNDGIDDLAISAPGKRVQGNNNSGYVFLFAGGEDRMTSIRGVEQRRGRASNEAGDRFGSSLAVGDFNNDNQDDLAVGTPNEFVGAKQSGYVFIFKSNGNRRLSYLKNLNQRGLGSDENGDLFGYTLAVGDFNRDGLDDLVVSALGEFNGGNNNTDNMWVERSGVLFVFKGRNNTVEPWIVVDQKNMGANEHGDLFGYSLAVGDFNKDNYMDLAVGAPGEKPGSEPRSGALFLFKGSRTKLNPYKVITQETEEFGLNEEGDWYGCAVVSADFHGTGYFGLAVGVSSEAPWGDPEAGIVYLYSGDRSGPNPWWTLTQSDLGRMENGDLFGSSMALGDFVDRDGRPDLAVGAPGERTGRGNRDIGYVFIYRDGSIPKDGLKP